MSERPIRRVGFIGVGNQGAPIAARIAKGGYPLHIWARRSASTEPFQSLAAAIEPSPAALGSACDMVGICVHGDDDVRDVILRDDGLLGSMAPGSVIVCHSTVAPATVQELAAMTRAQGVELLDAPVSGGAEAAEAGTLTLFVGGTAETFERCRPVFETFSSTMQRLGEVGTGQALKLVNNGLLFANVAAALDTFELIDQMGIDRDAAAKLMMVSTGRSDGLARAIGYGANYAGFARSGWYNVMLKDCLLLEHEAQAHGVVNRELVKRAMALPRRVEDELAAGQAEAK